VISHLRLKLIGSAQFGDNVEEVEVEEEVEVKATELKKTELKTDKIEEDRVGERQSRCLS
jgi:hypothetical protein